MREAQSYSLGAVRAVPMPPPSPTPASASKDPIFEENIGLLTKNIKLEIKNVEVQHEMKGKGNQYSLVFENVEDTTKAYKLLLDKYAITPASKKKENQLQDNQFAIFLNDSDVEKIRTISEPTKSAQIVDDNSRPRLSEPDTGFAGGGLSASRSGDGTAQDASDSNFVVGTGGATPAVSGSLSFPGRNDNTRERVVRNYDSTPAPAQPQPPQPPSPELQTSDCFSCIRVAFKNLMRSSR